ncbi:hypothetical protein COH21_007908 [Aspergillus flavus]|nr:hypothetical protein COH21_007908 [Aspergillus flavus]
MSAVPCGVKPEPPYTVGWRCTAHSHEPPRPTLVTKDSCRNFAAGRLEKAQLSPVERCLKYPPLPGLDKPHKVDLEIIEVEKDIFKVSEKEEEQSLIYDPLYVDDDEDFLNPFACMDRHYTHESAAYITLADLMGEMIPKPYGSFSVSVPVDEARTRTVR